MSARGGHRPAVPAALYSSALLRGFAAGEHEELLQGRRASLRPRVARALQLAAVEPGQRVVDVGCGRGEAAAFLTRLGARVTALDYSPDALALTRATIARLLEDGGAEATPPRLVAAAAEDLPLASGWADRVLLLDVVEHLWPWQLRRCLAEVRRILRPGGCVVIHTLPNRWALSMAYPVLRLLAPELPQSPRSGYEHRVHVNEQSPLSLHRALQDAGLDGRVWVEEWSTRHADRGVGRSYPDPQRARGYPVLRRPAVRRLATWAMRSPLRWWVGNDLFAVARRPVGP